ncbi:MAG: PQQ-dependent sugar dehydrogenase [Deinococcales bacterium]
MKLPRPTVLRVLLPGAVAALLALSAIALAAPPLQPIPSVSPATVGLRIETVTKDLHLPVSLTTDGSADGKLYISELNGIVRVFRAGALLPRPFLDLSGQVTALRGEDGFYDIAFHPGYPHDPRFYAAFTPVGGNALVVMEYRLDPATGRADPSYHKQVLRVPVDQPYHHGGQLAFGPDGYLYVSTGDGQEANHWLHEPPFMAQRLDTLRGKVLRIDVDHGDPYAIPPDNPFVDRQGARGEIWALGFRNPWKFTFDPKTGALYLSDVGNDRWEEVDKVVAGGNYGWPIREGPECQAFPDTAGLVDPQCALLPLRAPIAAYAHPSIDPRGGNAIVGGVVYRGRRWPALDGRYLFGDFVNGRVWSLMVDGAAPHRLELLADTHLQITSFAQTPDGRLYFTSMDGSLHRITVR